MKSILKSACALAGAIALTASIGLTGCTLPIGTHSAKTVENDASVSSELEDRNTSDSSAKPPSSNDWMFTKPVESESGAVARIHDLLARAGKDANCKFDCEGKNDRGWYVVRGYEEVKDAAGSSHTATLYRYSISNDVQVYDEILQRSVDPYTMS